MNAEDEDEMDHRTTMSVKNLQILQNIQKSMTNCDAKWVNSWKFVIFDLHNQFEIESSEINHFLKAHIDAFSNPFQEVKIQAFTCSKFLCENAKLWNLSAELVSRHVIKPLMTQKPSSYSVTEAKLKVWTSLLDSKMINGEIPLSELITGLLEFLYKSTPETDCASSYPYLVERSAQLYMKAVKLGIKDVQCRCQLLSYVEQVMISLSRIREYNRLGFQIWTLILDSVAEFDWLSEDLQYISSVFRSVLNVTTIHNGYFLFSLLSPLINDYPDLPQSYFLNNMDLLVTCLLISFKETDLLNNLIMNIIHKCDNRIEFFANCETSLIFLSSVDDTRDLDLLWIKIVQCFCKWLNFPGSTINEGDDENPIFTTTINLLAFPINYLHMKCEFEKIRYYWKMCYNNCVSSSAEHETFNSELITYFMDLLKKDNCTGKIVQALAIITKIIISSNSSKGSSTLIRCLLIQLAEKIPKEAELKTASVSVYISALEAFSRVHNDHTFLLSGLAELYYLNDAIKQFVERKMKAFDVSEYVPVEKHRKETLSASPAKSRILRSYSEGKKMLRKRNINRLSSPANKIVRSSMELKNSSKRTRSKLNETKSMHKKQSNEKSILQRPSKANESINDKQETLSSQGNVESIFGSNECNRNMENDSNYQSDVKSQLKETDCNQYNCIQIDSNNQDNCRSHCESNERDQDENPQKNFDNRNNISSKSQESSQQPNKLNNYTTRVSTRSSNSVISNQMPCKRPNCKYSKRFCKRKTNSDFEYIDYRRKVKRKTTAFLNSAGKDKTSVDQENANPADDGIDASSTITGKRRKTFPNRVVKKIKKLQPTVELSEGEIADVTVVDKKGTWYIDKSKLTRRCTMANSEINRIDEGTEFDGSVTRNRDDDICDIKEEDGECNDNCEQQKSDELNEADSSCADNKKQENVQTIFKEEVGSDEYDNIVDTSDIPIEANADNPPDLHRNLNELNIYEFEADELEQLIEYNNNENEKRDTNRYVSENTEIPENGDKNEINATSACNDNEEIPENDDKNEINATSTCNDNEENGKEESTNVANSGDLSSCAVEMDADNFVDCSSVTSINKLSEYRKEEEEEEDANKEVNEDVKTGKENAALNFVLKGERNNLLNEKYNNTQPTSTVSFCSPIQSRSKHCVQLVCEQSNIANISTPVSSKTILQKSINSDVSISRRTSRMIDMLKPTFKQQPIKEEPLSTPKWNYTSIASCASPSILKNSSGRVISTPKSEKVVSFTDPVISDEYEYNCLNTKYQENGCIQDFRPSKKLSFQLCGCTDSVEDFLEILKLETDRREKLAAWLKAKSVFTVGQFANMTITEAKQNLDGISVTALKLALTKYFRSKSPRIKSDERTIKECTIGQEEDISHESAYTTAKVIVESIPSIGDFTNNILIGCTPHYTAEASTASVTHSNNKTIGVDHDETTVTTENTDTLTITDSAIIDNSCVTVEIPEPVAINEISADKIVTDETTDVIEAEEIPPINPSINDNLCTTVETVDIADTLVTNNDKSSKCTLNNADNIIIGEAPFTVSQSAFNKKVNINSSTIKLSLDYGDGTDKQSSVKTATDVQENIILDENKVSDNCTMEHPEQRKSVPSKVMKKIKKLQPDAKLNETEIEDLTVVNKKGIWYVNKSELNRRCTITNNETNQMNEMNQNTCREFDENIRLDQTYDISAENSNGASEPHKDFEQQQKQNNNLNETDPNMDDKTRNIGQTGTSPDECSVVDVNDIHVESSSTDNPSEVRTDLDNHNMYNFVIHELEQLITYNNDEDEHLDPSRCISDDVEIRAANKEEINSDEEREKEEDSSADVITINKVSSSTSEMDVNEFSDCSSEVNIDRLSDYCKEEEISKDTNDEIIVKENTALKIVSTDDDSNSSNENQFADNIRFCSPIRSRSNHCIQLVCDQSNLNNITTPICNEMVVSKPTGNDIPFSQRANRMIDMLTPPFRERLEGEKFTSTPMWNYIFPMACSTPSILKNPNDKIHSTPICEKVVSFTDPVITDKFVYNSNMKSAEICCIQESRCSKRNLSHQLRKCTDKVEDFLKILRIEAERKQKLADWLKENSILTVGQFANMTVAEARQNIPGISVTVLKLAFMKYFKAKSPKIKTENSYTSQHRQGKRKLYQQLSKCPDDVGEFLKIVRIKQDRKERLADWLKENLIFTVGQFADMTVTQIKKNLTEVNVMALKLAFTKYYRTRFRRIRTGFMFNAFECNDANKQSPVKTITEVQENDITGENKINYECMAAYAQQRMSFPSKVMKKIQKLQPEAKLNEREIEDLTVVDKKGIWYVNKSELNRRCTITNNEANRMNEMNKDTCREINESAELNQTYDILCDVNENDVNEHYSSCKQQQKQTDNLDEVKPDGKRRITDRNEASSDEYSIVDVNDIHIETSGADNPPELRSHLYNQNIYNFVIHELEQLITYNNDEDENLDPDRYVSENIEIPDNAKNETNIGKCGSKQVKGNEEYSVDVINVSKFDDSCKELDKDSNENATNKRVNPNLKCILTDDRSSTLNEKTSSQLAAISSIYSSVQSRSKQCVNLICEQSNVYGTTTPLSSKTILPKPVHNDASISQRTSRMIDMLKPSFKDQLIGEEPSSTPRGSYAPTFYVTPGILKSSPRKINSTPKHGKVVIFADPLITNEFVYSSSNAKYSESDLAHEIRQNKKKLSNHLSTCTDDIEEFIKILRIDSERKEKLVDCLKENFISTVGQLASMTIAQVKQNLAGFSLTVLKLALTKYLKSKSSKLKKGDSIAETKSIVKENNLSSATPNEENKGERVLAQHSISQADGVEDISGTPDTSAKVIVESMPLVSDITDNIYIGSTPHKKAKAGAINEPSSAHTDDTIADISHEEESEAPVFPLRIFANVLMNRAESFNSGVINGNQLASDIIAVSKIMQTYEKDANVGVSNCENRFPLEIVNKYLKHFLQSRDINPENMLKKDDDNLA